MSFDLGMIKFVDMVLADRFVDLAGGVRVLGGDDQTGRIAVEPVADAWRETVLGFGVIFFLLI